MIGWFLNRWRNSQAVVFKCVRHSDCETWRILDKHHLAILTRDADTLIEWRENQIVKANSLWNGKELAVVESGDLESLRTLIDERVKSFRAGLLRKVRDTVLVLERPDSEIMWTVGNINDTRDNMSTSEIDVFSCKVVSDLRFTVNRKVTSGTVSSEIAIRDLERYKQELAHQDMQQFVHFGNPVTFPYGLGGAFGCGYVTPPIQAGDYSREEFRLVVVSRRLQEIEMICGKGTGVIYDSRSTNSRLCKDSFDEPALIRKIWKNAKQKVDTTDS